MTSMAQQEARESGESCDLPDIWWKNADKYINEIRENAGTFNCLWHSNYTHRRNLNPQAFLNMHLGSTVPWRSLVIHHWYDIAVMHTNESPRKSVAAWPIWSATLNAFSMLEDFVKNPISQREEYYSPDRKFKPSRNQEHCVVIMGIGDSKTRYWRGVIDRLADLQEKNPQVKFLICDLVSFGALFGKRFRAIEADPLTSVTHWGKITLPSGKVIPYNTPELQEKSYWLNVIGFDFNDLQNEQKWFNMVAYNICSYEWARRYYLDLARHTGRGVGPGGKNSIDWRSPEVKDFLTSDKLIFTGPQQAHNRKPTDRIACSSCSLWAACKYFRDGSVCSVPGSEMEEVARMFGSRDANDIINAMGRLMKLNTERIIEARNNERNSGELDPELTKVISNTMNNAEKLAKLRNPELNGKQGGVTVNNNINQSLPGGTGAGSTITPAVAMHVVAQLEASGVKREDITEELVQEYLTKLTMSTASGKQGATIKGELA